MINHINLKTRIRKSGDFMAVEKRYLNHLIDGTESMRFSEWVEDEYGFFHCINCRFEFDEPEYVTPYCPNCGARMDGGNTNGT